MEISEAIEFIRDKRHGTILALRENGRPQSSNISFYVDETDTIVISVTDSRSKTKNLRRDPRASLHVNREDFYGYVVIEADVELTPVATEPNDDTTNQLVEYFRAVGGEHDNWDEYRQAMVDEGRLLLKLRPTHAYGMLNR